MRMLLSTCIMALAICAQPAVAQSVSPETATARGIVRQRSAFGFDDTVSRLRADIASKGIRLFDAIDQSALGMGAGRPIRRSTLLLFGNPPLGVQFLEANPLAGLDWPVRMLVTQDANGAVWVAWSDFAFIADRYAITDRDAQLRMASEVAASIAASTAR